MRRMFWGSSYASSRIAMYRAMRYIVPMSKVPRSHRLSETALRLMKVLSVKLGISQTAVIEQALRLLARREKIDTGEG